MMEIKFFVLILGALTPPPRIEEPVMKIPLLMFVSVFLIFLVLFLLKSAVYWPCSSDDRETDTEGDTGASPCVRRDAEEEVSDLEGVLDVELGARVVDREAYVESFTLSIEEHV
jgi:hypothetical protein